MAGVPEAQSIASTVFSRPSREDLHNPLRARQERREERDGRFEDPSLPAAMRSAYPGYLGRTAPFVWIASSKLPQI